MMASELDKVKSTITISLGTKNRLRKLKGSNSYEQFINHLMRSYGEKSSIISSAKNVLEVQTFKRKTGIYGENYFGISFSYNEYMNSDSFFFDIELKVVRKKGVKCSIHDYFAAKSKRPVFVHDVADEYKLYFKLLEEAIQQEIEPLFKHNGTFVDYFKWREEFKMLNLSMKSFDEDVMEKLNKYEHGLKLYDWSN